MVRDFLPLTIDLTIDLTADEGSSPKHIVFQALGYILYLTYFMYSLVIIAAHTNKQLNFPNY